MLLSSHRSHWLAVFLLGLILAHLGLVVYGLRKNYVTLQEVRAVPIGLQDWRTGDFRFACDQPPLPRLLAVLPLVLAGVPTPEGAELCTGPDGDVALGQLFAAADRDRYFGRICLARLMGLAWSLLGMALVYRWARDLYGGAAGVFAVVLWCIGPAILAYEQLATPDLPAAVAGLGATYAFWCYLHRPTWGRAAVAGILLGVAQLTEFNWLLLYPIWLVLYLVYRANPSRELQPDDKTGRENKAADQTAWSLPGSLVASLSAAGRGAVILGLSIVIINQGYGWQNTGRCLGDFSFVSRSLERTNASLVKDRPGEADNDVEALQNSSVEARRSTVEDGGSIAPTSRGDNRFRGSALAHLPVPLPESYVLGFDRRRHDAETGFPSYGFPYATAREWFPAGWGDFGIRAVLVKVPLGAWVLLCWSFLLTVTQRATRCWADETMIWLPLLILFLLAAGQWGFRFPIHTALLLAPFAIVAMSKLAGFLYPWSWKAGSIVVACCLWVAGSSLSVYPHSLAYANELAGGPGNPEAAYLHGNWDCGQDLLYVRDWANAHPEARPVNLAYCNTLDPNLVYLKYFWPPINPGDSQRLDPFYAQMVGPLPGYYALDLFHLSLSVYQYFHRFQPIARAGYSIFIYHITPEAANEVRGRLGLPLVRDGSSSRKLKRLDGLFQERGFLHRVFKGANGRLSKYVVFVPYDYRGDRAYPLILYLHGFGKAGTDGVGQLVDGLAPFIRHEAENFGFLTVFPQGPRGIWEPESDETKLAMDILAEVQSQYNVDPRRLFLSGISSGGTGTWTLAAMYPERWAGIVPIASPYQDFQSVDRLKHVPCWCFHNVNDVEASVEVPRRMIAALRSAGGHPRYTEFVSLAHVGLENHNAWDKAYAMPLLYDWLQRQRHAASPQRADAPIVTVSANPSSRYSAPALVLTIVYALAACAICFYGAHRYWLAWLLLRDRQARTSPAPKGRFEEWPMVTVQLPMFNERHVAERSIQAACALDYPRERLQIQVLDDSTDESAAIGQACCARMVAAGHPVDYLHRCLRDGFKGGALAAGMKTASGEFIAVFDADFLPTADFLRQTVPYFTDPRVGVVQAEWSYLNRGQSWLTELQAMFLDGHFVVEQTIRSRSQRWFNFNGTAGVWRRQCIDDAGGWQHDTLTEDTDLSYRAQLKGWKFLYLPTVRCDGELPSTMRAFLGQQHRWTKGLIQTAKKLLLPILLSHAPWKVKLEAWFHLTSPLMYLVMFIVTAIALPALFLATPFTDRARLALAVGLATLLLGTLAAATFYVVSQRVQGFPLVRTLLKIPLLMALGIGICAVNARAVVEALVGFQSPFVRTPKFGACGDCDPDPVPARRRLRLPAGLVELLMAGTLYACLVLSFLRPFTLIGSPFLLLFALGYSGVGLLRLLDRYATQTKPIRARRWTPDPAVWLRSTLGLGQTTWAARLRIAEGDGIHVKRPT